MSLYEDVRSHVAGVAIKYHRRFGQWTERDDIAQELWVWVTRNETKVGNWMAEDNVGTLVRALQFEALHYCQREKAERSGYQPHDIAYWGHGEVESLLPAMFSYESWLEPPQSEGRTQRAPAEGGNWIASLADLARAYAEAPEDDRDLLYGIFGTQETQHTIAQHLGVSDATVHNRKERALRRLHETLGGARPGDHCGSERPCEYVGSRRAMSGAQARAITANQYEE